MNVRDLNSTKIALFKTCITMAFILCLFVNTSTAGIPLHGTYTIGTGGDYSTFSSAVTDLIAMGVSGPVTFEVASGTYTERFVVTSIAGASATNTIKFISATTNAVDVVVTESATDVATNFIVMLDGAQYVTFEKMTFKAEGTSYCTAFELRNSASNNSIIGNIISGDNCALSSENGSLIHGNQTTIGTDLNSDNISITGNTFNNGGIGLYFEAYGFGGSRMENTTISANTFNNQYNRSIYLKYSNNSSIIDNTISSTTNCSSYYGMYVSHGGEGTTVAGNAVIASSTVGSIQGINVNNFDGDTDDNYVYNEVRIHRDRSGAEHRYEFGVELGRKKCY
ncbi:hypothetical protein JW960_22450, partial [candidate division KSB1 bacterium]|nr:hypothetical protein [candidate division KSB1 bacterium]